MGILSGAIPPGVNLQPPLYSIVDIGLRINDAIAQGLIVLKKIFELVILGHDFMSSIGEFLHGIEGMLSLV